MHDIQIRGATAADADTLARVGDEAFRAAYAAHNSPQNLAAHLQAHFTPAAVRREIETGKTYAIAALGTQVAGLCKYCFCACPPEFAAGQSLQIEQFYIAPDMQRRGVGKLMVSHTIDVARRDGLAAIWLSVWEKADWAIQFYRACGFEPFGEVAFYVGDERQNDLLMGLRCEP